MSNKHVRISAADSSIDSKCENCNEACIDYYHDPAYGQVLLDICRRENPTPACDSCFFFYCKYLTEVYFKIGFKIPRNVLLGPAQIKAYASDYLKILSKCRECRQHFFPPPTGFCLFCYNHFSSTVLKTFFLSGVRYGCSIRPHLTKSFADIRSSLCHCENGCTDNGA